MAKFYGDSDRHLRYKDLEYWVWAGVLALLPFVALFILLRYFTSSFSAVGVAVVLVLTIVVIKIFDPLVYRLKRTSSKYYRGWSGERDISRLLQDLPDSYSVFRDVRIGDHKGNLDFVVVGPGGIFILEVKAHGGDIGYNGYALTVNGHTFADKNFFNQIHGQTWALKNYLEAHGAGGAYIHSALVFSNPHAQAHFGYNLVNRVYIIQKDFLLGLFSQSPPYHYTAVPREKIEAALADVAR